MNTTISYLNIKEIILKKIKKNGGWVNCHAHIDRAFTITPALYKLANKHRHEKWKLNIELRKNSTIAQLYDRMAAATELLLEQGVTATASFIDVDQDIQDKAILASQKLRDQYKNQMEFKFITGSNESVFTTKGRKWFEIGAEYADIIGGVLKSAQGQENPYLDVILQAAKEKNKMVHMHVDELNTPEEIETEILANKTIEHSMEGKVVGIHAISLNAHPENYRKKVYELIKKANLMIVSNPISWLNARRSEILAPIHNPIAPVDEMLPLGITVGIGVDNIADLFMPLNDGNMWNDLRALMEENRMYDIDTAVQIATSNGRKILGI